MIVVRVELWPHGNEAKRREIAQMKVANVGGDLVLGDYVVESHVFDMQDQLRTAGVTRHERARPVLNLVYKALAALGYG